MKLEVECYSGWKGDERPVRFRLDGHEYLVEELLDQWYGPSDSYFKVRADDGNLYILRRKHPCQTGHGIWNSSENCPAALLRHLVLVGLRALAVARSEKSRTRNRLPARALV